MISHKKISTLMGFLLLIIPLTLSAQRYVSGRITDAENGDPVIGASVFIANSTIGITTDAKGYYRLKIPGTGSYRLTIAHAGYQPVFEEIEPGNTSIVIDAALQIRELEELSVSVKVKFRKEDINLFWKTILGREPSKKVIYATNPETPYFYYNSKTKILKVTCRDPLQIVNLETGYHIEYVLNYFTHDYNSNISSWEGQFMFDELAPDNIKQKNTWERNREKTYNVSITKFIKSLYRDSLMADGFVLTYNKALYSLDHRHLSDLRLAEPGNLLSVDSVNNCKTLFVPLASDSIMLVCFGKQVTSKELGEIRFAQNKMLRWSLTGLFRNILGTPGDTVRIFPDGTFQNTLKLIPKFNSKSLTGLNMTLPIDYNTGMDSGTTMQVTDAFAGNEQSAEDAPKIDRQNNPPADSLDNLVKRFDTQLSVFPQEKVYLQTDKPYYISGERIWFRAHLVNAASHVPDWSANSVYVELFDSRDSVASRVKVGFDNDMFSGYIPVPEDVPEGYYTLRAYTNLMRNMDEDYFFLKSVHIGNPVAAPLIKRKIITSGGKISVNLYWKMILMYRFILKEVRHCTDVWAKLPSRLCSAMEQI